MKKKLSIERNNIIQFLSIIRFFHRIIYETTSQKRFKYNLSLSLFMYILSIHGSCTYLKFFPVVRFPFHIYEGYRDKRRTVIFFCNLRKSRKFLIPKRHGYAQVTKTFDGHYTL